MKSLYKFSIAATVAAISLSASAQSVNSGYFMENYLYRHQMNPAFGNTGKGYVGFPALGNLNIGMQGSLNVNSFIWAKDGKTMLFTNPSLTADEVMSKFHDHNKLGVGLKLGVIDFGFKAFGGYNTVGINVVADAGISVPKSLISLMKEGISNQKYDISNFALEGVGYAEIALNHSRDIKQVPGLRVGATVKFLVGAAALKANFKEAYLELQEDSWNIASNAEVFTAIKGVTYEHDYNSKDNKEYVSGLQTDDISAPNGFGVAFDFGAEYQWRDFRFSAAVTDLGFINFSECAKAGTNGLREVRTDKYTFEVGGNDDDADDEWDKLADDISELYQLTDNGVESFKYNLKATLNFGVEYELPVYRKVRFGLLNTTRIAGPLTSTEFRLSANFEPCKIIGLNINGVAGTYGVGMGWMVNLRVPGFNLFAGMDRIPGKFSKQMIPLNSNANVFLGIDFPF